MSARKRIFILPVAALIILSVCIWRVRNPRQKVAIDPATVSERRAAPEFQLYNQHSRLVQLQSFLNRHPIVLVFFDGAAGVETDPVLSQLREFHTALEQEGYIILGVSTELPQRVRAASADPFPFDLLSDVAVSDANSAHRQWGRLQEPESPGEPPRTSPAVFLIDRSGLVAWQNGYPQPVENPGLLVSQLLSGT